MMSFATLVFLSKILIFVRKGGIYAHPSGYNVSCGVVTDIFSPYSLFPIFSCFFDSLSTTMIIFILLPTLPYTCGMCSRFS